MKVLVTGAGLVGCHAARELTNRGHSVMVYDLAPDDAYIHSVAGDVSTVRGDVRDLPALTDAMREHSAEVVFHSAALIGGNVAERPYTGLSINIGGTIAVAEAARLQGVRRIVYAGTFGVYNRSLIPTPTVTEDSAIGGANFYSSSKIASEQVLRAYAAYYKFELGIVRFAGVYGYGHYRGGSSVGKLMHGLVTSIMEGGPVSIDPQRFGSNEYVYARDVAQGVSLACENPLTSDTFNIGTGIVSSAADVAEAVRTARPEVEVELGQSPQAPTGPSHQQPLDLTRSRAELGYSPQYDLTKGILDCIAERQGAGR